MVTLGTVVSVVDEIEAGVKIYEFCKTWYPKIKEVFDNPYLFAINKTITELENSDPENIEIYKIISDNFEDFFYEKYQLYDFKMFNETIRRNLYDYKNKIYIDENFDDVKCLKLYEGFKFNFSINIKKLVKENKDSIKTQLPPDLCLKFDELIDLFNKSLKSNYELMESNAKSVSSNQKVIESNSQLITELNKFKNDINKQKTQQKNECKKNKKQESYSPCEQIVEKPSRIVNDVSRLLSPILPQEMRDTLSSHKYLQVALDLSDLNRAIALADIISEFPTIIVEVGDPLIKRFGLLESVRQIKESLPGFPLVVEMATSDWVEEDIDTAALAGADIISLMGLRDRIRMERAINAARKNNVGIILELPPKEDVPKWCKTAEELGVDGIAIIRNIDLSTNSEYSLNRVKLVRNETNIPIAVSGGFTPSQITNAMTYDWNIIIVGRAIVNAPDPRSIIQQIMGIIERGKN